MKSFIASILLLVAVCFAAGRAQAQTPTVYTIGPFNGGTNVVAALSTNTTGYTIACSEYDKVGVQYSLKCTAASAGSAQVRVYRSTDGSNYETTPSSTINLTCNGTTTVNVVTDLTLAGCATLKFVGPENTNATAIFTNVSLKVRFNAPRVRSQ